MNVAIIAAAGSATRMGVQKIFLEILGKPVIAHCLERFEQTKNLDAIILVVREDMIKRAKAICQRFNISKVKHITPGGKRRSDSVWEGLKLLPDDTEIVAVHDGARPNPSIRLIERCIECAKLHNGCVPGIQPTDTVKLIKGGSIERTVPREKLILTQTPQCFKFKPLLESYRRAKKEQLDFTDDAGFVEHYFGDVMFIPGEERNIKLTTLLDIELVRSVLSSED
ncbi:2-C-methyl-D-erythritol 4-phosphate cytidylyltransferase [bacterium]|nr:2-C-methyl-D-erythritol 4-phosphate cytidylyltransferase [bacterium]